MRERERDEGEGERVRRKKDENEWGNEINFTLCIMLEKTNKNDLKQ